MNKITEIIPDNMPDWMREGIENGNLFSRTIEYVENLEKDSDNLIVLADAMSDLVLGGECGWEQMDFKDFVALCRKNIVKQKRLARLINKA